MEYLVTHEHRDHIHGVGVLAREVSFGCFANQQTWGSDGATDWNVPVEQNIYLRWESRTFGDIDIESFGVSHDGEFIVSIKKIRSFVMLTDTGYLQ